MSLGRVHGDAPRVHRDLVSLSRRGRRRARPALVLLLPCALPFAAAHAQSTPAPEQAESALPTVTVTSDVPETASGPANGFVARRSATGTKTDTPLAETPQAITIITRDLITDTGATNLQDALNYAAGVRSNAYGLDSRGDWARIRGTDPSEYLDGLQKHISGYYTSNTRTDPYTLERIEVLRGPSGMLFGQGSTGGLVNMVSKRPQAQTHGEIGLQYGSFNRKQVQGDFTGALEPQPECTTSFDALLAAEMKGEETACPAYVGDAFVSCEQSLNPDNRVRLTGERDKFGLRRMELDWSLSDTDMHTLQTAATTVGRLLAERDAGRLKVVDWLTAGEKPDLDQLWGGNHHMGTTRMSADPATGVVDADLKVHSLANLYVGGSSTFATSGHANPTYTIVQLSLRLGDHLADVAGRG